MSDFYTGGCSADPATPLSIEKLTRCCNPGYARTVCAHAATAEADSHRFLVTSDDGGLVEIAWASERDHHPIAVGTLRIARELPAAAGPLEHQARACALTYLHQTGRE
jgi:hypothetical protein